jgi:hypothetical protein
MPTVQLSSLAGAGWQFFDNNGVPLVGGKLYTYAAGTSTPTTTYTSSAGSAANTNPVVLDAAGRTTSEIWLVANNRYKFVLETSTNVQIWSFDNIPGVLETSTLTAADVSFTGFKAQVGTVQDLADSDGSNWVGFTPTGTGAVAQSVQEKLQKVLINRDDYDTVVNFDAAVTANPTIPSLNDDGNFDAKVTPAGEDAQIDLSDAVLPVATSNRGAVRYRSATSVSVSCARHIPMGGFRFFGQYSKGRAPMFSRTTGGQQAVSLTTDLGAESAAHLNGWYAVFACADNGDAAPVFKLMPCLRVGSVAGSQVTLCSAAEGVHTNTATTYNWSAVNNLNGVDCLVINETVDGRANAFSGRVTTITANTISTVTLASIGSVGAFDWLLPAPVGFDHYCYQGMFYYETPGDVRNIADSGSLVKAKMINTADPNWSATGQIGSIASPVAIRFGGYISPLATGVVVKDTASFSTSGTGTYAAYFDIDGSQHIVQTAFSTKEAAATETQLVDGITVPFCFTQEFYYSNDGSIIAQRSGGTLEITGWIEN